MLSTAIVRKIFCALLGSVLLLAGWAAFTPASASGGCTSLCVEAPQLCPPGQSVDIGMKSIGGRFVCCVGCGSGTCVPNSQCSFGPHNCRAFCTP